MGLRDIRLKPHHMLVQGAALSALTGRSLVSDSVHSLCRSFADGAEGSSEFEVRPPRYVCSQDISLVPCFGYDDMGSRHLTRRSDATEHR